MNPPTWYHQVATSSTTHELRSKGNIVDGASLVPLVDYFPNDCLHYVDPPITMLHASSTSPCDDLLPIYDEYDD